MKEIRGNAMIFSLILLMMISLGVAAMLRWSFSHSLVTRGVFDKTLTSSAAEELLSRVRNRLSYSVTYFSDLSLNSSFSLSSANAVPNLFASYRDNPDSFYLVRNLSQANVEDDNYFLDWTGPNGMVNPNKQTLHFHGQDIFYRFSVRCIPDTTTGGNDPCLTGQPRSSWDWKSWSAVPKKMEIIVHTEFNGASSTYREVDEMKPLQLTDYVYALGSISNPNPLQPFTMFGNQYFGRVHFDSPKIAAPSPAPGASPQPAYRIVLDASQNPFIFNDAFTTAGLQIDYLDHLSDKSVPLKIPKGADVSSEFQFLTSPNKPEIVSPIGIKTIIQNSVATVGAMTPSEALHHIPENSCFLTLQPKAVPPGIHLGNCAGGASYNIAYPNQGALSLYFDQEVYVNPGVITSPIAVFAKGDIVFYGPVTYGLSSSSPAKSGDVFVPKLYSVPDVTASDPLSIAGLSKAGGNTLVGAVESNQQSLAMWVSNQDVVISAQNFKPFDLDTAASLTSGSLYTPQTSSSKTLEQLAAANVTSPTTPTMTVLDGKIEAAGTLRLSQYSASELGMSYWNNMGDLLIRGGISSGVAPVFKEAYSGGACPANQTCFHGFERVGTWYDNRPQFGEFPGQPNVPGQIVWQILSIDKDWNAIFASSP